MTIYDASYIALAIGKNTQMVTADEKIKKKLPQELKEYVMNLSEFNKKLSSNIRL